MENKASKFVYPVKNSGDDKYPIKISNGVFWTPRILSGAFKSPVLPFSSTAFFWPIGSRRKSNRPYRAKKRGLALF